ncbi:MAG TPA: cell surface protein, partial [Lactobacillus sp.]|nr:cell surface protein [Lactobacillus sp.]
QTPAASQNSLALPWIIAGIATGLLIIILGIWRWTVVRHKQNQ